MQVDFYHLSRSPVERVLPRIAERVLAGGGRLLILCGDGGQAARLDEQLWSYAAESFLPHGRAEGADAEMQPVLIATAAEPLNGARNLALADGAWRDEALAYDRAFLLFDDDALAAARDAWRGLAARAGVSRNFWKQEDGGWVKAA